MRFFLYTPNSGSKLIVAQNRFPADWLRVETLENQSHHIFWEPEHVLHVRLTAAEAGCYYRAPAKAFLRKVANQALAVPKFSNLQTPVLFADVNGTLLLWLPAQPQFVEWVEARLRLIAAVCGKGAATNFNRDWHVSLDAFSSIEGFLPYCHCEAPPNVADTNSDWSADQ